MKSYLFILLLFSGALCNVSYECECTTAAVSTNYCSVWICDPQGSACFSENSLIHTDEKTLKKIKDMKEGDQVLTINPITKEIYKTEFIDFLHLNIDKKAQFLQFHLNNNEFLEATPDHILYTIEKQYTRAEKLAINDTMIGMDGSG